MMRTAPQTIPIPRVHGLSLEDFERDYRIPGRPVVLTGKMDHWPARKGWSFAAFKERFGQTPVVASVDLPDGVPYFHPAAAHRREMTLGAFVDLVESRPARPCYVAQLALTSLPGLAEDVDFAPLRPREERTPQVSLWIGSANTRSGMHFDGDDNLYAQVVGTKRILMAHPDEASRLYPFKFDFCKSQVEAEDPDLERYPEFSRATLHAVDLGPGEILFMPRVWWHQLRSLEPSMSLSHHFGEVFRLGEHTRMLNLLGPAYWAEILKQFVVNGVLGRKTENPLYSQARPGKMFYDFLKDQLVSKDQQGGSR